MHAGFVFCHYYVRVLGVRVLGVLVGRNNRRPGMLQIATLHTKILYV
jgi:hypothetical protein